MPGRDKRNPLLFLLYILERKALARGYKSVATAFWEPSQEMNFSLVAENYKADDLDTTYPTVTPASVICQTVVSPFMGSLSCSILPFPRTHTSRTMNLCPIQQTNQVREEPLVTSAFRASENGALVT